MPRLPYMLRVPPDSFARGGGRGVPTVAPELRLRAHKLVSAIHADNAIPEIERVESGNQFRWRGRSRTPHGGPGGRISEPESLGVQTLVSPARIDCAHQIGVVPG